jgi:hypothetical protein
MSSGKAGDPGDVQSGSTLQKVVRQSVHLSMQIYHNIDAVVQEEQLLLFYSRVE